MDTPLRTVRCLLSQLFEQPALRGPIKKQSRTAWMTTALLSLLCFVLIMHNYRNNWRGLPRQLESSKQRQANENYAVKRSEEPVSGILQMKKQESADNNEDDDTTVSQDVSDTRHDHGELSARRNPADVATNATKTTTTTTNSTAVIPNVLIAGAQKGGTTSIAHYLHHHHSACFSNPNATYAQGHGKESHFFDIPWIRKQGLEHYQSLFAHCLRENQSNNSNTQNHLLVVDGTPEFMKFPKRIRQTYEEQGTADQVKIIFSLREPVARELSWYRHRVRDCRTEAYAKSVCNPNDGMTPYSFAATVQRELVPKLRHGNYRHMYGTYALYLQQWFQLFDRTRQILVLSYDEAQGDPDRFLQRIQTFLDLDTTGDTTTAHRLPRQNTATADQKSEQEPPCEVQRQLWQLFAPLNEQLYQLLEEHPGPAMEQRPFPRFTHKCVPDLDMDETTSNNTAAHSRRLL